jgi:hypothetical protein
MTDAVRYHLGCGDIHLDDFVNVDIRKTTATDLTADLNQLDLPGPAEGFFSHAFFEHLKRDARVPHLRAARKLLSNSGFVCYIGLPDFRAVAELYLQGGPGIVGPTFDLYNVYRYTHGDPEHVDHYFEQLHKSLFDVNEIKRLLADTGFGSYVVFTYVFPSEPVAVTLGFYATPGKRPVAELEVVCRKFMRQFEGVFYGPGTLRFLDGVARPPLLARWRTRRSA